MKEYPILFSGPMVRAIIEGRKTQTRRIDVARWLKRKRGDRLWVRETWCTLAAWDGIKPSELFETVQIKYIADNSITKPTLWPWGDVRTSMFMPRWASRLLLELTEDPYAENVQDISGEDAIAEGVSIPRCGCEFCSHSIQMCPADQSAAVEEFAHLWDSINAKRGYGWDANPEVAVVRFKLMDAMERAA